jgi:two-component system CheB/CheR fusion protein
MSEDIGHTKEPGPDETGYSPDAATPGFHDEPALEFPIVGIGASAGGLAAFEKFFTALPPDPGMAFIVVQHLSPPHKSILPEILQRYTTMPVTQVTNGLAVKPNSVYVIPPGSDLALRDGHLTLLKLKSDRGYHLPIDFFFRSLAQDQGAGSIGIVLSGTGSDGSLGLRAIKAEGGLAIAQEPETAEFGDMPRNAIATREVDFIVPPEKMGELIIKYTRHQVLAGYNTGDGDSPIPADGLQKLYSLLRAKTGHDFSLYKKNTLMRRIERRMKIGQVKDLDAYFSRIQAHPEEIEVLFQEMLINVTHFFRDPEAFEALTEKAILPLILMKHVAHTALRVWVAGCSSGEEAYSVAIAIQEQIEALKLSCTVQIFATDLDPEAIATARKGFYSYGSLENVSAERLQKFFNQEEEGYQIKKNIRNMVLFSTQNLVSDPVFSKIDLLCCRNLLIYLEHELQNHLFHQFHYSLNPEGILFLGNSESIGSNRDLFAVIDRKYKLFQRKDTSTQRFTTTKTRPLINTEISLERVSRSGRPAVGGLREWTEKVLLEYHSPACVIIDKRHNILFIHGRTGKYLEPVPGETNSNLIRMAREGLKTELATAIHAAITHKQTVRREGIRVKTNGDFQVIDLTVRLINGLPEFGELVMVVFEETQATPVEPAPITPSEKRKTPRVDELEKALKEKDEYLHTIINELEDTNQDLKSTVEELQSANEEMQSSNEELETSKEELQSINEELGTINAELQNKNEELTAANNDVYNLLTSIEIGTIFLDLDLRIRKFTPAVNQIYNIFPADIGRPISHFVSNLKYDHLLKDIQQVLNTLVPRAAEVQAKDGTWYLINIRPYRTLENVIDGAIITFVDISEQKHGDELRRMGTILRDSNDAITVQDFTGKILAWNRGSVQIYGWTEAEALTMNALEMIPEDKRSEATAIFKRLSRGEDVRSFETQRVTRDGKVLDIWLTLTALVNDANQPVGVATTERDITGWRRQ